MLELTIILAQGLKNPSSCCSLFSHRLKPFITITTFPSPSSQPCRDTIKGCNSSCNVYTTRVYDEGGPNPTWGDKFLLPLDNTFFTNNLSCVYLQLFRKRALLGPALMGWIQIPGSDICDGHFPLGLAHHLSYRLRERDGSRGHGVVNVACKFVGEVPVVREPWSAGEQRLATVDMCKAVIGVPMTAWPKKTKCRDKMDSVARTCYKQ